jgi:hypothetical protein
MPKLSAAEQLDIAIMNAARDADPSMPTFRVAEEFYGSNRQLIQPFTDPWVIAKLAMLIGKDRAKVRRENNPQLVFEDILGLKRLPKKLKLKSGKDVRRGESTIEGFRRWAVELRKQDHPALEYALRAIEMMASYTPTEPHITWAEVLEREAKKKKRG